MGEASGNCSWKAKSMSKKSQKTRFGKLEQISMYIHKQFPKSCKFETRIMKNLNYAARIYPYRPSIQVLGKEIEYRQCSSSSIVQLR
tara:strand:+ start:1509 stop:1769 length:261 start_codon:yes stop_codon:yes gene_type:complete